MPKFIAIAIALFFTLCGRQRSERELLASLSVSPSAMDGSTLRTSQRMLDINAKSVFGGVEVESEVVNTWHTDGSIQTEDAWVDINNFGMESKIRIFSESRPFMVHLLITAKHGSAIAHEEFSFCVKD